MTVRIKDEITNRELTLRDVTRAFYNEAKDELSVYMIMSDGREKLVTYKFYYIIGVNP